MDDFPSIDEVLNPVNEDNSPDEIDGSPVYDDTVDVLFGNSPLRYVGFDREGSHSCAVFQTPNGTKYWCPEVKPQEKPIVGKIYESWGEVINMYQCYAELSGFGVRLNGYKRWKGQITHRILVCNRYGVPKKKKIDTLDPKSLVPTRASTYKVCDCKALIRLKAVLGSPNYILYDFAEKHNHSLISSENMDLNRKGKNLKFEDIQFIHKLSLHRIGPTVAHRLQAALKGGHHNVSGTRNAFKNVSRDIRTFIGDRDVQLVVKKLEERAANLPNFSYEFLHQGGEIKAIFWADDVSRISYKMFGDVLAFDATYSTNKYNMIFVPFTGIDHHKRCVTFGAGLISNETAQTYQWLLEAFLKVHIIQPKLVLTDQDPAMRIAVSSVFNRSAHRLCMWHIMKKLPSKIAGELLHNSKFRASIHKLVWNVYIPPLKFEERWEALLKEYKLEQHVWLNEMYSIRMLWVPAYFREIPMCCLMKTTSRCESSNALFKVNSTSGNTLVQFFMCFDTSIDHQRYNQRLLEFKTSTSRPDMKTGLEIESHAADVYTQQVFKEIRKEIYKGMMLCFITNCDEFDQSKVYTISHMDHLSEYVNQFQVRFHIHEKSYECTCMGFTRVGFPCRHLFCVFRIHKVKQIPDRYVAKRWTRNILPSSVYSISSGLGVDNSDHAVLRNDVIDSVNVCVDRLRGNVVGLSSFAEKIMGIKKGILDEQAGECSASRRSAAIHELVGEADDLNADLIPPQGIRNKGCGTNRRLVGPGEKAIEKNKKTRRLCRYCNEWGYHDSRNCPLKKKDVESPDA